MTAWLVPRKVEREERKEYPPDAIREAIVNAVVHRDYESPSKVQVRVFDKIGEGKRNLRYVLIQNAAKMRQEMRQKGD